MRTSLCLLSALALSFLVIGCNKSEQKPVAEAQQHPLPAQAADKAPGAMVEDTVWVGKSDEARSCEADSGVELYAMENDLKSAGVNVLEKRKFHDTKMRIQMCGVDKGTTNGFRIPKKDADKAKSKGFELLPDKIVGP